VVGHALCDSPSSENAVAVLRAAIARHGLPEKVRTDRGGAFLARTEPDDFARVLEAELIDHVVGRPYRPQGGGKVEALIRTIRRELWDVQHIEGRAHAEQALAAWVADYNERRAHMGIDGLTPADRYFGRADRVLAALCATARRRAAHAPDDDEATLGEPPQATEILRLMIVEGTMELRFCGARLPLGRLDW
jgi:RNA-directed DNA polymerase